MKLRIGMKVSDSKREALERATKMLAERIEPMLMQANAHCIVIGSSPGAGGWITFITNASAKDTVSILRELADDIEAESTLSTESTRH